MKKQHIHPLLLVTAVFLAFLLGFAAGRNYNHADVQVSVIPADSLRAAETSAISATSPLSILPIAAVSKSVPVSEPNTESQTIIPTDMEDSAQQQPKGDTSDGFMLSLSNICILGAAVIALILVIMVIVKKKYKNEK